MTGLPHSGDVNDIVAQGLVKSNAVCPHQFWQALYDTYKDPSFADGDQKLSPEDHLDTMVQLFATTMCHLVAAHVSEDWKLLQS